MVDPTRGDGYRASWTIRERRNHSEWATCEPGLNDNAEPEAGGATQLNSDSAMKPAQL